MRRRTLVGLLASLLTLAIAVSAWAVGSASNTEVSVNIKTNTRDAGSRAVPKATTLNLELLGKTKNGNGQPATSTSLNVVFPKGWIQNSKRWPQRLRCDINRVNAQGDDSVCPRNSAIGRGKSIAKGGANESQPSGPSNGLTETIDVTAYVIKNGNIGFFLDGKPVTIRPSMIEGKVSGRKLNIAIPTTVQEPVPGAATGIERLQTTFNGRARVNGKRIGILETRGCSNRRWTLSFTNVFRGGARQTNTDTVRCTK